MNPETNEDIANAKSARKFMWILMLIPIGLGVGVVMSNINFRKVEAAKADVAQFRVSQSFDKANFQDDMEKIFRSSDKDSDYFLRYISSTLGINNYLTKIPYQGHDQYLGYYDIKGKDDQSVTAVVVELDENNPIAKSALLAIPTEVIKSLAGEKGFSHKLRFIFLPEKFDGNEKKLLLKKEQMKNIFILRAGGEFTTNDDIAWRMKDNVWQHPAIAYPHESVSDRITLGQVEMALKAAVELKAKLESEMQK